MPIDSTAHRLTEAVENAETLDAPAKMLVGKVGWLSKSPQFKDLISGTQFGHPAHPPLTELVVGSFMSSTMLDVLAPRVGAKAANRLTAVGIAAFVPTALSGASDWADTEYSDAKSRRVGLVHAVVNVVALVIYILALIARRRGNSFTARLLSLTGAGVLSSAGYLGGHMTFVRGVGVNQTAFEEAPQDWTPVLAAGDLEEGKMRGADAHGVPVLLSRLNGQVFAIHDRCSHRGCPISEGGDGMLDGHTVTCFCHGSKFDVRDGSLLQGPAIIGQPTFESRENDGQIEVRKPADG